MGLRLRGLFCLFFARNPFQDPSAVVKNTTGNWQKCDMVWIDKNGAIPYHTPASRITSSKVVVPIVVVDVRFIAGLLLLTGNS